MFGVFLRAQLCASAVTVCVTDSELPSFPVLSWYQSRSRSIPVNLQGWSKAVAERITHTHHLAVVAAVYIYNKLRFTPGQRYLHSLPQLLECSKPSQLSRRSPYAAPARRDGHIIQQIGHKAHGVDRYLPAAVRFAATTSTTKNSDTHDAGRYRRSCPPSRCISTCSSPCPLFPFSLTSEASPVGTAAWSVSALVCSWLSNVNEQCCAKIDHPAVCQPACSPALVQQSPTSFSPPQLGPL